MKWDAGGAWSSALKGYLYWQGKEEGVNMRLEEIREEIDRVDSGIIRLLSKRSELVSMAGKLKKSERAVRDSGRVMRVIGKVRAEAEEAGLDPAIAEKTYRAIIDCFVDKEVREFTQRSRHDEGRET
jgi:isochorismate pyruvate lyase